MYKKLWESTGQQVTANTLVLMVASSNPDGSNFDVALY